MEDFEMSDLSFTFPATTPEGPFPVLHPSNSVVFPLENLTGDNLSYTTEDNLSLSTVSPEGSSTINGHLLPYRLELDVSLQIGLYSVIFLLAVLGNVLVILTLIQNQGMRTITNLFLLNLAIADLLVGVLCMPFSLTGTVLKDFIFGPVLCKLIPYLQAVSVSVSAWSLVAISVERYYAICHPLTSRRWQTLSHAYRMICLVWILSGISMLPIAGINTLQPIRDTGRHKCRENWPDDKLERAYTVFLDFILLVLPLGIMSINYSLITRTLWRVPGTTTPTLRERSYISAVSTEDSNSPATPPITANPKITVTHSNGEGALRALASFRTSFRRHRNNTNLLNVDSKKTLHNSRRISHSKLRNGRNSIPAPTNLGQHSLPVLRRCNVGKSIRRKKRVIQMLSVVVAEFFVCWTPLYVMNTWYLFSPSELYNMIGPLGVSLIQLIAYLSSCVNPITYCFMNRGFRMAFFHVFGCHSANSLHRSFSTSHQRNESLRLARSRSVYKSPSENV